MEPHLVLQSAFERAALVHERAADFWDRHDEPEKAALERNKATSSRLCADLERLRLERERGRSRSRAV